MKLYRGIILLLLAMVLSRLAASADDFMETPDSVFEAVAEMTIALRDCAVNHDESKIKDITDAMGKFEIATLQDGEGEVHDNGLEDAFGGLWDAVISESRVAGDSEKAETGRGARGKKKGKVFTKRYRVEKNGVVKYSVKARDRVSVAAVPEAKGLVSLRIHASNRYGYDKYYNDKDKFHQGDSYRKQTIALPDKVTKVDVEIFNRTDRDITFVLISR